MYLQIENEFKKESRFLKQNLVLTLSPFALIAVLIAIYNITEEKNRIAVVIVCFFIGLFLMWITFYAIIYFKHVNKEKRSFCAFFRFPTTLHAYQEKIHNEDIQTLKQILKKHKIDTRPKLEEVIKHYQCVLPRKVEQSGQLLSILAFAISVLALLLSETVMNSAENMAGVILILSMLTLFYLITQFFNRNVLKVFSKESLYECIESSLAEIFMIWYLKEENK